MMQGINRMNNSVMADKHYLMEDQLSKEATNCHCYHCHHCHQCYQKQPPTLIAELFPLLFFFFPAFKYINLRPSLISLRDDFLNNQRVPI